MAKLLLSLHDVCPAHLSRVEKAEAFFLQLGVNKITYLLIPAYHGDKPCNQQVDFINWCRRERSFAVDWFLHGYTHIEDATELEAPDSAKEAWKQKHLTASEGEFGRLSAQEVQHRLDKGMSVFEDCIGTRPKGFVAPAWLYNRHLAPALTDLGFCFNENHGHVEALQRKQNHKVPVITWATRTPFKKMTSIIGTPILARLWQNEPVLRLAVHPFDFDYPDTMASIEKVWNFCMDKGLQHFYDEAF